MGDGVTISLAGGCLDRRLCPSVLDLSVGCNFRSGGRLPPPVAEYVASSFMGHPNIAWTENGPVPYPWSNAHSVPGSVPPPWAPDRTAGLPVAEQKEWAIVHNQPSQYEHARWLTGRYLSDVMGHQPLHEDDWLVTEPGMDEEQRVRDVLARSGDFVAMVNFDRSFRRLIERRLVLEEVARREVRSTRGV